MNVSNQPIQVNSDEGVVTVGTYSIQGRQLKLVFDFNDQEIQDITNGVVVLNLDFDLEKLKENIEQEIQFNDSKETTLNVIAKPTGNITYNQRRSSKC